MKIIDLSVTLRKDAISIVPGHPKFDIKDFHFHDRDFRSNSFFKISTHTGTHVDAPYHFVKEGKTIDELSLDKIVGEAILIDLRNWSSPKKGFSISQIQQAVDKKEIKGKIVILHSGWMKEKWGGVQMYSDNPFLTPEAADWLVDKRIKSLGVDFSIDNPNEVSLPLENRFPIHKIFLRNGIPLIENLYNLDLIYKDEFLFIALPLKLHRCNGAPARVIAIIEF